MIIRRSNVQIHPNAIVHPNAKLADDVVVGPFCVVGEHVTHRQRDAACCLMWPSMDGPRSVSGANSIPLSRSADHRNIWIIKANPRKS